MVIICLDMEGVLAPEIWPIVAEKTGIPELLCTSLDHPDLTELNLNRFRLLKEHGIKYADVVKIVENIEPFEGAPEFLDKLRKHTQVCLISDAAVQFVRIIGKKLGNPLVFTNWFEFDAEGELEGFHKRIRQKADDVCALQSMGYETIAAGDSQFDVSMIKASKAGFLFRSRETVKNANPDIRHFTDFSELYEAIVAEL